MKIEDKNLIIDTHAHLNFKDFEKDLDDIIEKNLKNNIWVINAGSNYKTSKKSVEIANKYSKGVYSSVGFHPIHATRGFNKNEDDIFENEFDYDQYKKLALSSNKVVAIGETGLDYYYKPKNKSKLSEFKEKQKNVFIDHIKLSQEVKLPLILHCRMAHQDLLEILKENEVRGVIHCYTGNWEDAQKYLELGLYIGFTGVIFKKIDGIDFKDVIKKIPLNRILIETDCPYLIPPQVINNYQRNEPFLVKYIAQEIAQIKGIEVSELIKKTTENAINLFNLKLDKR